MNILFYCSEYPPYKSGGIGSVTKIIAEELANRGHNVYVVGYYATETVKETLSVVNGVNVYRYNLAFRNSYIKNKLFVCLQELGMARCIVQKELSFIENKIQEIIIEKRIDILELTDYYYFNFSARKLEFLKFNIPTILRVHGSVSFLQNLKGKLKHFMQENDAAHFNRCDYISAVSKYSLKYVTDNFRLENIKRKDIIYNPIEDKFISQSPINNSDTILFIGKLTETKGCFSLLKSFNICASKYPNLQLRLVGNGDIVSAKKYVNPQFVNRIAFLGFCDRKTIQKEIDNCSFACIPTYFENFSMVALEIMGRKRALIYTERTSGKEIIENEVDGLLVNPENINEIVDKISLLVDDYHKRDYIARNAYTKILQEFTCSEIIGKLEQYYSTIITNEETSNNK